MREPYSVAARAVGHLHGVSCLAAAGQIPASVLGPSDEIIRGTLELLLHSWHTACLKKVVPVGAGAAPALTRKADREC